MSHKIILKDAIEKYNNDLKSRELNQQGIKPKYSRQEKKRKLRMTKLQKFHEMLKFRGGHIEQKTPDVLEGKKK